MSARVGLRMRWLITLLLVVAAGVAHAGALPAVTYGSSGGTLSPGTLNNVGSGFRAFAANSSVPGEVLIRDRVAVSIGAANAEMYAVRALSFEAAIAIGSRAVPIIGTAALLYDLIHKMRCAQAAGGSWICDDGVAASAPGSAAGSEGPYYLIAGTGGYKTSEVDAACTAGYPGRGGGSGQWPLPDGRKNYFQCTMADGYFNYGQARQCPNSDGTTYYTVVGGGSPDVCHANPVPSSSGATGTAGPDGKVAGGAMSTLTPDQLASRIAPYADPSQAVDIARQAMANGVDASPYAATRDATGPATVNGPSSQTVNNNPVTNNSTTTNQQTVYNITYQGDTFNVNKTVTTTNPDGSTSTTTSGQDLKLCGGSGQPVCNVKIDESGVPTWQNPDSSFDDLKSKDADNANSTLGSVPTPDFGWFGAPPVAECQAISFPSDGLGHAIGSLNPCGPVDAARNVMAYLWAVAAAWLCFGWIRGAATGG